MSFFNADTLISGTDGLIFKDLGEIATTPSSGYGCIYVNADVLYFRTDGGTSTNLLAGGGGTPGGSDNQVQFNNSSSFGGSSNLTWDDTNLILASGKGIVFADTGEKISGDGSNITIESGRSILLSATSNVIVSADMEVSGTLFSSVSTRRQAGFDSGTGADPFTVYITKIGSDIITSIIIDLVGLGAKDGGGIDKYIIGDSGQTSAHILKFTNAEHGYLYKAELFCFQTIGLSSGESGNTIGISYDSSTQAGLASIVDELIQATSSVTLGMNKTNTTGTALPDLNNKYIYIHLNEFLMSGDSTYSTGKIRINLYGYNDSI